MNFIVPPQSSADVKKTLFKLKPLRRDGLLLCIHHSKDNRKIRFIYSSFHRTGHTIVVADNDGHLYVIDFSACKFWSLPKLDSCTFIKFSAFNENEILCGKTTGDIYVTDTESGNVSGKLIGHKYPAKDVSFAKNAYCLSTSQYEAIIWDLKTNTKVQVLKVEKGSSLKQVVYMPVSDNILACFHDDLIQIWNSGTETIKQFLPFNWNNFSVKSTAFSRNGQVMIIAGYLPTLAIFLLDKWKLYKLISLPEYIHSIKNIEFIPLNFDGGSNKILAILAGQGVLYFYDIQQNIILSELITNCEISKFECCPNGTYIACILCSGEVELYNVNQYISPPIDLKVENVRKPCTKIKLKPCMEKVEIIKDQINTMLDSDKLKAILKEYGEFPEMHRIKIWERLLELPNNIQQYNSIINHVTIVAFEDLYCKYPLEGTATIKGLKKLLNNMVTWCPFFAHVDYLPVFAFPFVKVFQNKPVACFETICTIILNFCQHWFEYFPLPPMNILAIIENMLMEHDPELLQYLTSSNVTGNLYAWSLLETAFSEVLIASEWLMLWDHILTYEPSFLLCAVVSYNIVHKNILTSLRGIEEFEFFYHNQNPNDMRKFINKTYYILQNTSEKIHPRQYLQPFKSIKMGNYPMYMEYPKTILEMHNDHAKELNIELLDLDRYESQLIEEAKRKWRESNRTEIEQEEKRRQKEMNKANSQRLRKEEEKVKMRQAELKAFRIELENEQQRLFDDVHQKSHKGPNKKQERDVPDKPLLNLQTESERDLSKLQDKFVKHFAEFLKFKYRMKEFLNKDELSSFDSESELLEKHQQKLEEEINKVKKSLVSTESLKKLNIAASISVMEKLIKNVERELQLEPLMSSCETANMRVKILQKETEELEREVSKLLRLLSKSKNKGKPPDAKDCCCQVFCAKTVRFSKSTSSLMTE